MKIFKLVANIYLLDTPEGLLLVDSGMPGEIQKLLRALADIKPTALLLTHHHLDHAGGARMLWEKYRLPIYAHPLDIPFIAGETRRPAFLPIPILGDRIANSAKPVPRAAITPIEEGSSLMGWRVVHLPGHTPGQIGLLKDGVLIAADALRGGRSGPVVPPNMVNADTAQAKRTVGKIAAMDVREIHMGHGAMVNLEAVRRLVEALGPL